MNLRILPAVFCTLIGFLQARADDWPQWRGPERDGVWRESGLVDKFAGPEVPIVWRAPIASGYSGCLLYTSRCV